MRCSTLQIPKFDQKYPKSKLPGVTCHGAQRQGREMVLTLLHLRGTCTVKCVHFFLKQNREERVQNMIFKQWQMWSHWGCNNVRVLAEQSWHCRQSPLAPNFCSLRNSPVTRYRAASPHRRTQLHVDPTHRYPSARSHQSVVNYVQNRL